MRRAAWITVASGLLLFLPAVPADDAGAFGDIVLAGGAGEQLLRSDAGVPDAFVLVDADNDRTLDAGEAVYLSAGGGIVRDRDVRIADAPTGVPGSSVALADADAGDPAQPLDGFPRYADVDGDGVFQSGDVLYFDLGGNGAGRVTINDVVLAGPGAGALVTTGDAHLSEDLVDHFGAVRFHDKDRDGTFDAGEQLYIDTDNDGRVTFQDVRLGTPFGSVVSFGDADATPLLQDGDSPTTFVFTDVDDDTRFDADESAYLARGTDRVRANDVRVSDPMLDGPGSQVRGSDVDAGNPASFLEGTVRYHDADGNARFSAADVLLFDLSVTGGGIVTSRDLVLSGASAGLAAGDAGVDLRSPLRDYEGRLRYMDVDGDERYGRGDVVYADTNENGLADRNDVRLSGPAPLADVAPPPTEAPSAGAEAAPATQQCADGTTAAMDQTCPAAMTTDDNATVADGTASDEEGSVSPPTDPVVEETTDDVVATDEARTEAVPPPGVDEELMATNTQDDPALADDDGDDGEDGPSGLPGVEAGLLLVAVLAVAFVYSGRRRA